MDGIEEILKVYEKRIYAFFLKNTKIPTTAEDLTQDVLMKLWIRRKSLENVQNMDGYVFGIAKNHVIDPFAKSENRPQISGCPGARNEYSAAPGARKHHL